MNTTREIQVASEFSRFPAGRYRTDGPYSGEQFRDEILVPALRVDKAAVLVVLDGTLGYGSSFLEEVFGGLVREHGFTVSDLESRLKIVSKSDPDLADEAWSYIKKAKLRVRAQSS